MKVHQFNSQQAFKKKRLAAAVVAVVSSVGVCGSAIAQSDENNNVSEEEVVVTGILGSLTRSMDIKRNSTGIVDAISAEDIGKFPDTNLAESLQRITGVSIDRQNGEGSRVTVRGFGPQFNLITINGRQLPNTTGDRTFDFDNVASELVSGVTVYKTSQAEASGGGIGATINLTTARPLDSSGMKAAIGGKLVNDTTTSVGSDFTPEISGLYSNTFADDKFGVSIAASYQERDFGLAQYNSTRGPRVKDHTNHGWGGVPAGAEGGTNRPTSGIYTTPNQPRYEFEENHRERLNGQLVLQYAPTDNVTATLDYTMVENTIETEATDSSIWFNYSDDRTENVWSDGPNSYPLIFSEVYPGPDEFSSEYPNGERWKDTSLTLGAWGIEETIDSVGFNLEWQATDRLNLTFDMHSSEAELNATDPELGTRNNVQVPSYTRTIAGLDERGSLPGIATGQLEQFTPDTFQLSGSWFQNSHFTSNIDQYKIIGDFEFNDELTIDFGIGKSSVDNRYSFSQVQRGDWGGVGAAGDFANLDWRRTSVFDHFESSPSNFEGTASEGEYDLFDVAYWTDFKEFLVQAETVDNDPDRLAGNLFGDCLGAATPSGGVNSGQFCASSDFNAHTNYYTKEDTTHAFFQFNLVVDKFDAQFGLRWEDTDVYSESAVIDDYERVVWREATSTSILGQSGQRPNSQTGGYDFFLPNLNINYSITDDLKARFAYGKTIARPEYDQLLGGTRIGGGGSQSGYSGNRGNPGLLPLESINTDLAIEWYYGEGSYASAGYFRKDVKNWTTTAVDRTELFDLYNPLDGPRFEAAVAALGTSASMQELRAWIFANYPDDPYVIPVEGGAPDEGEIYGDPSTDRPVTFNVSYPDNADREETVEGFEFNVQHLFGESGFGGIANYTIVDSGLKYDNMSLMDTEAIVGLSDSANLVFFYDKHGLQARIAYNWRDEFLSERRVGPDADETSPLYTEAYSQIDVNISYDIPAVEGLNVFLEGINLTENEIRIHGRVDGITQRLTATGARYNLGVRYSF